MDLPTNTRMQWQATGGTPLERGGGEQGVRVLVVDDHDLFRIGLRLLLIEHGFEVADASSGDAALRRLQSFPADVVVMDVDMPGMSGIAATPLVLAQAPQAVVVMLSATNSEAAVMDSLMAGACGYLLKNAQMRDIVAGIAAAFEGESPITPQIAVSLVRRLRVTTPVQPCPSQARPALSSRERDVLELLARGWDNAEIANHLHLSSSTVKNHVSRVFEKLCVRNRVQAAVYATQQGLIGPDAAAAA